MRPRKRGISPAREQLQDPNSRRQIEKIKRDLDKFNPPTEFITGGGGLPGTDDGTNNNTGSGNVDGGFAASVYLVPQLIDGGKANNGEPNTNPA